ncbi:zinc finger CCCH domain-containing protein 2-like [Phoenix dactylifera]|uniref:Zinc finger CCCH domain-containing protein 2-like n=1 Tax=Phoenix dactylifera TaxID=42345 RepID=A0A8B7MX44_PHODC|nr:zinc finger CCCH domain-containing protein 2-like [Phoenix dactylifera]
MPTFSTEQQQQLLLYGKNAHLDLDVPPRKLLHRPGLAIYVPDDDHEQESKFDEEEKEIDGEEEGEEEEEVDTYSCDEFRMYEFKVRRCMRGRSHDWTDCPFAHPGEKARRRDPRRYHYSGAICPDFRRSGACPRGDFCEFAHGVFECWLHPARYRTMPCKDGRRCRRKVCFFAHCPRQLRRLPSPSSATATTPIPSPRLPRKPSCCAVWPAASSPTSPLMAFSSPISPPISPSGGAFPLSSHTATGNNQNKNSTGGSRSSGSGSYKGHGCLFSSGVLGYDSVLYEKLMRSLEAMELPGDTAAAASGINGNSRRSSPSYGPIQERDFAEQQSSGNSGGPDLEWVNELLM